MDIKTKHDNVISHIRDLIAVMDQRITHYEDPSTQPKPCSTHYLSFWLGEKYACEIILEKLEKE